MKSILFVTDDSPHNIIYLRPLIDLLSANFKVGLKIFKSSDDRVISVSELNKFDLIITDISFHSTFRDPSYDELTASVLSINHSLLGPVNFNIYQTKCLSKLSDKVRSRIKCIYPEFYRPFMMDSVTDDPSTVFVSGSHRYILNNYNEFSKAARLCTYFNHWSSDRNLINDIINKFTALNYEFSIRMHPAYSKLYVKDNPFKTMKNISDEEVEKQYGLMRFHTRCSGLSLMTHIDSSNVLVFDGLSGTLVEALVRKCITFDKSGRTEFYMKRNIDESTEYSYAHRPQDIKLVENMLISLGAHLVYNDEWLKLTLDNSNISKISEVFGINNNHIRDFIKLVDSIIHYSSSENGHPELDKESSPLSVVNLLRD